MNDSHRDPWLAVRRFFARLEESPAVWWLLALLLAWACFVGASVAVCGAGFLHPESYSFLPHYLSGRPFLALIYDNRVTDWGNYQARELAFVFDWLDCQFISSCVRRGQPHFFSVSHYALFLVAGFALWRIATKHLALSRSTAFGMVLLVWTGPTAMFYSSFYRSAKVSLFCATLLAVWAWLSAVRQGARGWRVGVFGLLLAILPMCDKQGLLFLFGMVVFLARNAFVQRDPRSRQLLIAGLAAAAFAWSYQRFVGPAITQHLLGYAVNRGYASVPFRELATQPRFLLGVIAGAAIFTLDSLRVPLGNLPVGLGLVAAIWIGMQFGTTTPAGRARWLSPRWLFLYLGVLISGVFAAMLMLFPAMFSTEHRRFFYPLPVSALWLAVVAAALREYLRRWPARNQWVEVAVAALVVSNVAALQEHRFIFRHGKYAPYVANAARVQAALRPENMLHLGVDPASAREKFAGAPYFQDAVPPALEQDRIFLLFLARRAETP